MDLAALLRILDQNWAELAHIEALPREARNWLKELQNIRNRWAHAPVDGFNAADTFRDADTLGRLLRVLQAEDALLERVDIFKAAQRSPASPLRMQLPEARDQNHLATPLSNNQFSIGQLICLRSNTAAVFPVIEAPPSTGTETRYRVFENGTKRVYYESQLKALNESQNNQNELAALALSAMLTGLQLSFPSASSLYSLNSGRVRFVPYQYRPVFKLIRAEQPRLLIADEVGVGKTIEAGLILKELQARNDIKSVLIICPKALVAERKWELEMKRFDEHFIPLDGPLLRHCMKETHLSGSWPVQYEKAIIPMSLFNRELLSGSQGLLNLDPPPKFDLLIVDEAHHIRNSETFVHQAVRYFSNNAEAVVFLSATPVQLGREDLYTLLNVLQPDVIIDQASFNQMAEPNQFINTGIQICRRGHVGWADEVREQLRQVSETAWGKAVLGVSQSFQKTYDALAEVLDDASVPIKTIQSLEALYTFSALINRTRRRDIGEFTTRKATTLTVAFTNSQKRLHDDLLDVIARILVQLHNRQNVKFMMTTISRQAASSLHGLAPLLYDKLQGKIGRLESECDRDDVDAYSVDAIEDIRSDAESLLERASMLDTEDPKAEAFIKVITDKVAMPKNKVLVFSYFLHTLKYLEGKFSTTSVRFGVVHGDIPDEDRAMLRQRFSLPKEDVDALDVLLSSQVGCEGLDFQFCDCLVNYDLPWNPMQIEQRIGRIDRYGQQSETIAIFNFVTPGTIDAEIYARCLWRIGVFQHAIGGNEEILGEITKELRNIEETFSLSAEERAHRLQQLEENQIRQFEEEQRLVEREGELVGLNLDEASWNEKLVQSRNHWLEPQALAVAVTTYLRQRLGTTQDYLLGDKPLKTLRMGMEARTVLLNDFRQLTRYTDPAYRAWEKWLKGTLPTLPVTFEQESAVDHPTAVLLSLGHPLLRQAASHLQQTETVAVRLSAFHETLPEGIFPFAIYRWTKQGIKRDEELVPVVAHPDVSDGLLELLHSAVDAPHLEMPLPQVWDDLDAVHHHRWLTDATQHAAKIIGS